MEDRLAFVFSGGGAKGAFGVGVLRQLRALYPRLRWQIVSGTSTGALITPLAALGSDEPDVLGDLRDLYVRARQDDIVDSNFDIWDIPGAILDLPEGLYNSDPLKKLIKKHMSSDVMSALESSDVTAIVNAVNLYDGALVLCTQDKYRAGIEAWFAEREAGPGRLAVRFRPFQDFRRMMRASSAIPGAIDPVSASGEGQLVDGGVVDIAPLRAAIAAGATHIVTVLMSPRNSVAEKKKAQNLLEVALRSVDLLTDEIMRNDVEVAARTTGLRALAKALLAEKADLPKKTKAAVKVLEDRLETLSNRTAIELHVIEPDVPLGDTLDFDSERPKTWPESSGPGERMSVMRLRYRYGKKMASAAVESRPRLRTMLEKFAVGP